MDVWIPVLMAVLVGLAFFVSLRVRSGANSRGGITDRPAPPGTTSGSAQDTGGDEDRDSFHSQLRSPGTR